jgi:TRAP-type C4-dicarboxylate transport system substrate-binding protein
MAARRFGRVGRLLLGLMSWFFGAMAGPGEAVEPIRLKIVGGLAGVAQYTQIEEPFWREAIGPLSGGRVSATIHPFDQSGLRAQEMLQLIRLGVVPFGSAILSQVAGDEPELSSVDLPGLNPDIEALRQTIALYRPRLARLLAERYGIELLGVYTYPAQVIYCQRPFSGLEDLRGRRVRTSSVGQSDMIEALGGKPVILPFADIVAGMRRGIVDCAVTGTLSGHEIRLYEVTSHIHAMALSWGISVFGANAAAWDALPPDVRDMVRDGVAQLERRIWAAAAIDTATGLACNAGRPDCPYDRRGRMEIVPVRPEDDRRRTELLRDTILPHWIERCGEDCARSWNQTLALATGLQVRFDPASGTARAEAVTLRGDPAVSQ